ncbi:glucosaminidase domain-containing protein [uncultured Paraglaciecola sp.]|uniref:glucosaminidase domain-containing protein n=1 Tax=uncultured Paraglaciecola sp. TaxID=1765024 RepID=UPI00262CF617|nr:glucosaminidase domain-containing protein [uncultured Paraglaciecola sp.]
MPRFITRLIMITVVTVATTWFIVAIQEHPTEQKGVISLEGLYLEPLEGSKDEVPKFSDYNNIEAKKRAFFSYLLPEIRRQNRIVEKERAMVYLLQQELLDAPSSPQPFTKKQQKVYEQLKKKYQLNKVDGDSIEDILNQMLVRIDTIPEQLILVQAANESGWGTSRFAVDGYNFFGLWCFKTGCGFVPKQRDDEAIHEVAKFRDLSHSVMTYIRNINRLDAYKELRQIRKQLRENHKTVTAKALSEGLMRYSERGQEYIDELQSMLRVNKKYMELPL